VKTLLTARFTTECLQRLEDRVGSVYRAGFGITGRKLDRDELRVASADAAIVIVEYETLGRDFFASMPQLQLAACCRNEPGASVDLDAATVAGVPVLFPPGRNAVSVAEYTIGMMISVARHLHTAHHLLRHTDTLTKMRYADKLDVRSQVTSEWSLEPGAPFQLFQGPELSGKCLGIVGCGIIGCEIARRARAFGMTLLVADPYALTKTIAALDAHLATLTEVATNADFLVIAAKVTPETRGLVSREVLTRLKPTAYVINSARAAIMDYDALTELLRARRIAGAALDVFPSEPLPGDHPLRSLDNVLLSPHLAGASTDIPVHHSQMITDDILRVLAGERPQHLANPAAWERRRRPFLSQL
jgi:D-3-phosphoglycerate dehydrogenase / 2-oxoglutarate reductase